MNGHDDLMTMSELLSAARTLATSLSASGPVVSGPTQALVFPRVCTTGTRGVGMAAQEVVAAQLAALGARLLQVSAAL